MASPVVIGKPHLLVVEGMDALRFWGAATRAFGCDSVQVLDFGGNEQLHEYLKAVQLATGFGGVRTLVVGRDAEQSGKDALRSVQSALGRAGLSSPTGPFDLATGDPRVGIMLFQALGAYLEDAGRLEDLCLSTVDHPVLACVDGFVQCLASHGEGAKRPHKTRLHAYLAARDSFAGLKLGEAADRKAWDWASPALQPYRQFLV